MARSPKKSGKLPGRGRRSSPPRKIAAAELPEPADADPEFRAFVRAIIADPDNDLPRLVFADWLDERGDPRGEFIRVQVRLAQIDGDHETPQFRELHAREIAALEASKDAWFAIRSRLRAWDCRRGFVEDVSVDMAHFAAVRDELFREHPLRTLRIYGVTRYEAVINYAPLSRLVRLSIQRGTLAPPITVAQAEVLAASRITRIPDVYLDVGASRPAKAILDKAFTNLRLAR